MDIQGADKMQEKNEMGIWARALLIILLLIGICLISLSAAVHQHSALLATALRDIGFVFAPVAILALFYHHFAQKAHSRYVAREVSRDVMIEIEKRIGHISGHRDLIEIYPNRDEINLNKYISDARDKINILVTNLISLEMHVGLLAKLANDGVKVRILTLTPNHEFVKRRYKALKFQSPKQFSDEMVTSLRTVCTYKENIVNEDKKSNFSIRIHDNPPSMMLFQRDDRIIVGFILQQGKSRDYIHIDFDCSARVVRPCQDYIKHFELIWKDANDIDLGTISKIDIGNKDI